MWHVVGHRRSMVIGEVWSDEYSQCKMMKWMWGEYGVNERGTTVVKWMGMALRRSHGGSMATLPGDSPTGEHLMCTHGWESFAL